MFGGLYKVGRGPAFIFLAIARGEADARPAVHSLQYGDFRIVIAIQQIIANSRRNGTSLHSPAE